MDAQALVDQARELIRTEDYVWALALLRRALRAEPRLGRAAPGEMERRLDGLVTDFDLDVKGSRRAALSRSNGEAGKAAREAIVAFVEGRDVEAALHAAVAAGEDPQTEVFRLLLAAVSRRSGIQVPRKDLLPRAALVQLKLQRAERAMAEKLFGEAARECQESVWLDPGNVLAWTRLGSARWASGETEKARQAFEQVLVLNPHDAEVREFMRAKGLTGH